MTAPAPATLDWANLGPELVAALVDLESATRSLGQHLVYNAPTMDVRVAMERARAVIAKASL